MESEETDPFIEKYGTGLVAQFIGVASAGLAAFTEGPVDEVEARCVLQALEERAELTIEAIGWVPDSDEWRAVSDRLEALGRAFLDPDGDAEDPHDPPEFAVVRRLGANDQQLLTPWSRLAGEGAILRLADRLPYTGNPAWDRAVELLEGVRAFIMETYQAIPLERLRVTLHQIIVLFNLRGDH